MSTSVRLTGATTAAPSSTWVEYHNTPLDLQHTQHNVVMGIKTHTSQYTPWSYMWGTDLWVPYQSFHIFLLNGLCTFPRVCYTTQLTTGFFIGKNVSRRLDWHMKFCGVNIWNSGCSVVASATHAAITYKVPDGGTSVRVLENKFIYFCLSWGRCHLSNIPFPFKEGYLWPTCRSERIRWGWGWR